jgi:hypothetical protein
MKKLSLSLAILCLLPLVFIGCGQFAGDNPEGVTGGANGYGILLPGIVSGNNLGGLVGTWRHDYRAGEFEIVTLSSNGSFTYRYYIDDILDESLDGTASVSGDELFVEVYGGNSLTLPFVLEGNYLTIDWGESGGVVLYFRVE